MKRLLLFSFSILVIILGLQHRSETQTIAQSNQPNDHARPVEESELRAASAKALKVIQHSQVVWYQKQTCTSCHHQLLPEIAFKLARERGVPFDEKAARQETTNAFAFLKDIDGAVQGYDYIDVLFDGWALSAARVAGVSPSLTTTVEAQFIASRQLADGSWPTIDQRPPQAYSTFTTTAICGQALQNYLPNEVKAERYARVRKARQWLVRAEPRTTEDRTYQLLGLRWTGADERTRARAARDLIAEQHEDGGWSQLPGLVSDSYATGEVLVALHEGAGIPIDNPAYQRGLRFLLQTQQPDGSWRVNSRLHPPAPVSPPYVNTEFPPFQHDQFISIMGTTWATTALMHAISEPTRASHKIAALEEPTPAEQSEWMRVALIGSAGELKRLLDAGLKPDTRTAQGTSALMLASRDIEKVKLLLDRGADVNARAASGFTALMVAARYRGNLDVVRLLLKKGAKPIAGKDVEVRNDASAMFFAVMAGDAQMLDALLDAGARLDNPMKILGVFTATPLNYATFIGDPALIEYLISKGADPNEVDSDRISVLGWAAISNRLSTLEVLLARGARVNHLDKYGMTPLLYAASIDYGETAVLEKLVSAGADLKAKNKEGLTALDLAKTYRHAAMANMLAAKTASR